MFRWCRRNCYGPCYIKYNSWRETAARQAVGYIQVQQALFIHYLPDSQTLIRTDVTAQFATNYIWHAKVLPNGRQLQFVLDDYDSFLRTTNFGTPVTKFMVVTYVVAGTKLTALYPSKAQADFEQFPPYGDFSMYDTVAHRLPLYQTYSLVTDNSKTDVIPLNDLLQQCRGPMGKVNGGGSGDIVTTVGCLPHTWPLDIFCLFVASLQPNPRSWLTPQTLLSIR